MITINRAYLPESITYNKRVYIRVNSKECENKKHLITVNVLSRKLKGKLDLHGRPYKPTQWLFGAD